MRYERIVIASDGGFMAEILRNVLKAAGAVVFELVETEKALRSCLEAGFSGLLFLEDCFTGKATDELVYRLAQGKRRLRIVIWTVADFRPILAARFIFAGAESFITLRERGENVAKNIGLILAGRSCYPDGVREEIEKRETLPEICAGLSAREKEVIKLAADKRTINEMAEILKVKPCTIRKHRQHIFQKCGGNDVLDLVKAGIRLGIITADDL